MLGTLNILAVYCIANTSLLLCCDKRGKIIHKNQNTVAL
jgi:hypothetical protein